MIHLATLPSCTAALLVLLAGCTCRTDRASPQHTASSLDGKAFRSNTKRTSSPPPNPTGKLLPSEDYVAGIPLPRGAELFREEGLLHVYRIQAPVRQVLKYFGPLMITGSVERRGKGAVYRRATVRGAELSKTKVQVSIISLSGRLTRISVLELPPPVEHAPSQKQTKAAASQFFRELD